MPLANPPLPTPTKSSWSVRSWVADLAGCPAPEIELEYAGRWPGETRVRCQRAGQPLAVVSIIHPGAATGQWTIRAQIGGDRTEVIDQPDEVIIDY